MITQRPTGLRGLRALVFGGVVLLLAVTAHVLAGGALPSLPLLLGIGVPLACASTVLARRTRGLPALLLSLGAAQLVLHEVFSTTAGAMAACGPVAATTPHGAHHGAAAVDCGSMAATMAHHAGGMSTPMLLLHALATVATALLLAHGERLAVRLRTWVLARLTHLEPVLTPALPRLVARSAHEAPLPRLRAATDVSRRGPPARTFLRPVIA